VLTNVQITGSVNYGTNTITYTATDPSGNTAITNRTVIAIDTTPPTITPMADAVTNTAPGQCYATGVVLGFPPSSDACDFPIVTNNAPSQFPFGTNYVTWTARDPSGNSTSTIQRVIIRDLEPPIITCPGNRTTNGANPIVTFIGTATDNCPLVTITCVPPSGSAFAIGATTVRCTATDASGNTNTCTFTITVSAGALTILSPTDYQTFAGDSTTVQGTATFPAGVKSVTVNGAAATLAAGTNWSRRVSLTMGTNTFTVIATDKSSPAQTATQVVHAVLVGPAPVARYSAAPTTTLTGLPVTFQDKSTGNITARLWDFGDGQTTNAASPTHAYAAAGLYTVRLTVTGPGGSNTTTGAKPITIQPNFTALQGTYNGLILQTNAPTFATAGTIKVVLKNNGAFAANVSLGGVNSAFKGQFDDAGNATNATTPRAILHAAADQITGTVAGTPVVADRAVYSAKNPCLLAGKYNCLLAPATNPPGIGYAVLTVTASGSAALAGTLADGTALSVKLPVSKTGTLPLYKLLYANKGVMAGWVAVSSSNTVAWIKPGTTGFNTALKLTNTKLTPPAGAGTWNLTLAAGDLPSNVVKTVTISPTGTVTLPPADAYKLALKVTTAAGKFTGSFVHPVTTKPVPFAGLFLPTPANNAGGFFRGPNTSGAVTLEP
jgi:PKD repeat protein